MNKKIVIGLMLLAALIRESVAQSTPTALQLDQERQCIEFERKWMFDPNNPASKTKEDAMPNSTDIDREMHRVNRERRRMFDPNNPATKSAANVFPNVPAPERAGIDTEALAKQHRQKAQARKMGDLTIFASFAMSVGSPRRIVSQANRAGASVVLRGFKNNSLKDTALVIRELGGQGGNVLVNPGAFTKHKVKAVPTIVLARAAAIGQVDSGDYALPGNFMAVAGDVSLGYALDKIMRHAPQSKVVTSRYLRQIRGS